MGARREGRQAPGVHGVHGVQAVRGVPARARAPPPPSSAGSPRACAARESTAERSQVRERRRAASGTAPHAHPCPPGRRPARRAGACAQALPWEAGHGEAGHGEAGRSHMAHGAAGGGRRVCTGGARLRSMNSSGMPIGWRCAESRRVHLESRLGVGARLRMRAEGWPEVRVGARVRARLRARLRARVGARARAHSSFMNVLVFFSRNPIRLIWTARGSTGLPSGGASCDCT